jgi:hypothetical protein
MKRSFETRPRVALPRNVTVTQVVPMRKGKGSYDRRKEKEIPRDE